MDRYRILTLIIALALCISGCGNKKASDDKQIVLTTGFEEGELFFIGDKKCYVPEAKLYMRNLATNYEEVYGEDFLNITTGDTTVNDRLASLALSRLAEVKAICLLAAEREISLTDKEIEKCRQASDRYMGSLSKDDISDLGITDETLLGMYEDYALANKVYYDITDSINPEISDDEARIITVRRIRIDDTDDQNALVKANEIYNRLSDGADFDQLADEIGDGEQTLISFGKDTDEYPLNFVDACFELSTDEVSSPIVEDGGVSIVKCISTFDMEQTDAHKAQMVTRRKNEAFEDVYSVFVSDLYTGINSELWEEEMHSSRMLDTDENFFSIYTDIFRVPGIS
ncbi:MAG: peptidylprolyl isomerase [Lachnospiraceae bacterium]|nr:peptidylprolyl isomerase [Lachnospiraceae bacterium]